MPDSPTVHQTSGAMALTLFIPQERDVPNTVGVDSSTKADTWYVEFTYESEYVNTIGLTMCALVRPARNIYLTGFYYNASDTRVCAVVKTQDETSKQNAYLYIEKQFEPCKIGNLIVDMFDRSHELKRCVGFMQTAFRSNIRK